MTAGIKVTFKKSGVVELDAAGLRLERNAAASLALRAAIKLAKAVDARGAKMPPTFKSEESLRKKLEIALGMRAELEALGPEVAAALKAFETEVGTYVKTKDAYKAAKAAPVPPPPSPSYPASPKKMDADAFEQVLAAVDAAMSWFPGQTAKLLAKGGSMATALISNLSHPSLGGLKSDKIAKAAGVNWPKTLKAAQKAMQAGTFTPSGHEEFYKNLVGKSK